MASTYKLVLAGLAILGLTSVSGDDGKCIMYGKCTDKYLCAVDHAAKFLSEGSLAALEQYCPELTAKYGSQLCCSTEQVDDLANNLPIISSLLSNCPSCFYNFRQSICDFTCSPYQYRFLSPNETFTVESDTENINAAVAIKSLNFFIGNEYVNSVYESCQDVQLVSDEGNVPVMDILCGQWGEASCTPQRLYDNMGSTANGFAPFDIFYQYLEKVDENLPIVPGSDIVGYNNATYPCNEVPPGSIETCSCTDCSAICSGS